MSDSLGEAFFRTVVKSVATGLPGGASTVLSFDALAEPFCKGGWEWLMMQNAKERQQAITELARMSCDTTEQILDEALLGQLLHDETRAALKRYLSGVPMITRRAIARSDDGGDPQALLTQLPPSESALARFLPLHPPRFRCGDRVENYDFQLERLLGQGGFGEVWLARNTRRKKETHYALKFCLDPALKKPLVQALGLLENLGDGAGHENIVRLMTPAVGADPPFFVYEYVDGGDLSSWMAGFDGTLIRPKDVFRIFKMAACGLAYAHDRNVAHLDLKPQNLLITQGGRLKISDFGIGKLAQDAGRTSLTRHPDVMMYRDPETSTDKQKDLYALGVIFYQLLVGDTENGISPSWRKKLETKAIPSTLLDVLSACVDDPSERFADGRELLNALASDAFSSMLKPISYLPELVTDEMEMGGLSDGFHGVSQIGPFSRRTVSIVGTLWGFLIVLAIAFWNEDGPVTDSGEPAVAVKQAAAGLPTAIERPEVFAGDGALLGVATAPEVVLFTEADVKEVEASDFSEAANKDGNPFHPARALDGLQSTAWNVPIGMSLKAQEKDGVVSPSTFVETREWLHVILKEERVIRQVSMATGWDYRTATKGKDLFQANAHLRKVKLVFESSNGRSEKIFDVERDQRRLTVEDLNEPCRRLVVLPLEVWVGEDSADFCISEIEIRGE